jgi:hypothetical protein
MLTTQQSSLASCFQHFYPFLSLSDTKSLRATERLYRCLPFLEYSLLEHRTFIESKERKIKPLIVKKIDPSSLQTLQKTASSWARHIAHTETTPELYALLRSEGTRAIFNDSRSISTSLCKFLNQFESCLSSGFFDEGYYCLDTLFHIPQAVVLIKRKILGGTHSKPIKVLEIFQLVSSSSNIRSELNSNRPDSVKGAGKLLVLECVKICKQEKLDGIYVHNPLTSSLPFYIKMKFQFYSFASDDEDCELILYTN